MKIQAQKAADCMARVSVKVQDLLNDYPPQYTDAFKRTMYEQAAYCHRHQRGIVKISRWHYADARKEPLEFAKLPMGVTQRKDFFRYHETDDETTRVFWLNYADPTLFGFYGGSLFTQDEIQTLEHPLLGSVTEYINKNETPTFVSLTEEKGRPTPFIVENVPYWMQVKTNPCMPNGERANLYGGGFRYATDEARKAGITLIQHEQKNNVIAMAALRSGRGFYTVPQLEKLLKCVFAAFAGATRATAASKHEQCTIHTGNWGCGACGNSPELIYLAQLITASSVGVTKLVFHAVDDDEFDKAFAKFQAWQGTWTLGQLTEYFSAQHYRWGNGDGN